jgi:hypothetical protein
VQSVDIIVVGGSAGALSILESIAMLERSGRDSNAARLREDAKPQMEQAKLLRFRIVEVQKRAKCRYLR